MAKNFVLDTSAFITLESLRIFEKVAGLFPITTTPSAIKELENFAWHDDPYGRIAKRILKIKSRIAIESCPITECIRYIEQTDNGLYNLSREKKLPLVTDDVTFAHHARKKIEVPFSALFLVILAQSKHLAKNEALALLEKARDERNWKNNIIYLITKDQLEKLP